MRVLPLAFLLACTVGANVDDEDDTGGDTGTGETDTDTTDTDTDTGVEPGPTSTFQARSTETPAAETRVGTWLIHFDENGFVYVRDYSPAATVSAWPHDFDVAAPRGADLMDNGDGTNGAYWFVYAFTDTNGNGSWDSGEPIDGVAPRMLAYIDSFQGQSDVFFALSFDEEGNVDDFAAEDGFDLSTVTGPDTITLAGTTNWSGNPNGQPDRVGTFANAEFDGSTIIPGRPLDEALTSPFTWTISGAPDASRQIDDEGFIYALEIPFGYEDTDASGAYSAGDNLSTTLCAGADPVYLFWSPPPTTIEAASINALYALSSGWSAIASTATAEVTLTDTTGLTLSPSDCSFQ